MSKDFVSVERRWRRAVSVELIFCVVCIFLTAVGGALLRVRAAVKGVDINALMFYAWRLGIENLDRYEVVATTAAESLQWAIAAAVIALYIWISYWTRNFSISLRIRFFEKQVRFPLFPFHLKNAGY